MQSYYQDLCLGIILCNPAIGIRQSVILRSESIAVCYITTNASLIHGTRVAARGRPMQVNASRCCCCSLNDVTLQLYRRERRRHMIA